MTSFFSINNQTNNVWSKSERGKCVTIKKNGIISKNSKIFTIGSCFAIEVRKALMENKFDVYPSYNKLDFDKDKMVLGKYPEKDTLAYYTTSSIFQEISRAAHRTYYSKNDFIEIHHPVNFFSKQLKKEIIYQDPYRRDMYATSLKNLEYLSHQVTDHIYYGLKHSDVIVITLGLTESWKLKKNNLWACKCPKHSHDPEWETIQFHQLSFTENLNYLRDTIHVIKKIDPDKKIVLSVSPVPLGKTFTENDIVIANMNSKCTLHAVASQVVDEFKDSVFYWPSFEYAISKDIFCEDGRHVMPNEVVTIMDAFINSYLKL